MEWEIHRQGSVAGNSNTFCFSPNSEIGTGRSPEIRGAHAAGVPFSAARRKLRPAKFRSPQRGQRMGDDSLGGPPKLARGPRALPVPTSAFGFSSITLIARPRSARRTRNCKLWPSASVSRRPRNHGCYERGASRRQAAHGSAAASAGKALSSQVGNRCLRPRRLSAKA